MEVRRARRAPACGSHQSFHNGFGAFVAFVAGGAVPSGMRRLVATLALLAISACKPHHACTSWLEPVASPVTSAELALPIASRVVDSGAYEDQSGCLESPYGHGRHGGTLGPFAVDYAINDYKGQWLTIGSDVRIFDAACPGRAVTVVASSGVDAVALRYDPAREVYFIFPDASRVDRAVAVRVAH